MIEFCRLHTALTGARRALLALAIMICITGSARAQDAAKITIDNFTFEPVEITVSVGATVTWENRDDIPHSMVEKNKAFRSKALDTGDSFSFTFDQPGIYDYFCGLHPHMVGKIIVKP